ncbi:MAG TPA: TonB-dependent receptor [Polyangiaceae bacterium]|nr:TonB-dependent receptor [Polyangiaceae bacterium]
MPSRVRRTGADFTPASSSDTWIFARKKGAKRLIALIVLVSAFHARTSRAEPQAQPEAPSPTSEPRTPIEVTVQGEVPANPGSKLREPLRDVPSTVNTVTAKTLRERATTDLVEALRNVAGVNPILQYGGFSYLTVRGFKDFVLVVDGVRDDRFYFVESAPTSNLSDIARIDVLKGPASALYGYGGIGGVISLTRKSPTPELHYDAGVTIGGTTRGSGIIRRSSAGVGGPIAGTALSYRLDMGVGDDVDFRGARAESAKISGALEWRPNEVHRVLVRGGFSRDRFNTDTGIPTDAQGKVPAGIALDRRFNTAQDYLASRSYDVSGAYTLRPTSFLELNARINYTYNPYSYASAETLGLGPNETVTRGWFFLQREWKPLYSAVELNATGKALVEHRALVGYELGLLWAQNPQADLSNTDLLPVPYAKGPDPQGGYPISRTTRTDWNQTTHSVYLHDSMTLLPPLKLAVGARLDFWGLTQTKRNIDPNTLTVLATTDKVERSATAPTWRAGLVYQPTQWGTIYGSIATAFRPAREVPTDGRQLAPEHGRQFELGLRGEFLRRHLNVNLAGYDIEKTDVVVGRGAGVYDQAGKLGSRGVEVDAVLTPTRGFVAQAGYAFTRARYENYQSPDGNDYSGKTTVNVPDHSFSLWATYRTNAGIGFGLGGRAIGSSYADPANRVKMDAYALLDAALYYRFSVIELALNANNVLGAARYFVSSINDTQLTPGQPRIVLGSLRIAQ